MAAVSVNVKPEVLSWALNQVPEMKFKSDVSKKLDQWLAGTLLPTFRQIESFSKTTGIPLGYFFLDSPPEDSFDLAKFRTVDSRHLEVPSRELKNTASDMERIQDWMREYRQENDYDSIKFIASVKNKNIYEAAKKIRKDLDVQEDWFEHIHGSRHAFSYFRERLSECGVIVMMNGVVRNNTRKPLSIQEFRAFALVDEFAPLIFINAADAENGRLFSLLHEAVHLWLGKNDLFNDNHCKVVSLNEDEMFCNAVAAELLVPKKYFLKKWAEASGKDYEKLEEFAKVFSCSRLVIARKALDCGLINEELYGDVQKATLLSLKKAKEHAPGGNYYNIARSRLDGNFVRALCTKLAEGGVSYPEAYRLTNTNGQTFPHIARDFGGVGF